MKNTELHNTIIAKYNSQKKFAKIVGMSASRLGKIIHYDTRVEWRPGEKENLCKLLSLPLSILTPPETRICSVDICNNIVPEENRMLCKTCLENATMAECGTEIMYDVHGKFFNKA